MNVMMPQMGESVAEGTITRWFKKPGDQVERDEPLFEITTDKVDAEIPSPVSGVLSKILAAENETVLVNTVVAVIEAEGAAETTAAGPEVVVVPEAEAAPTGPPKPAAVEVAPPAEAAPPPAVRPGEKVRSSPLVRRIAHEHNIDLTQVKGTGLGGRISKKDFLAFLDLQKAARAEAQAPGPAEAPRPAAAPPALSYAQTVTFTGPTHVAAMSPQRRQIAEHMATSKKTAAHVTTVFEVEMTRIVKIREQMAQEFERRQGLKLTYTPFFARAAVEAIKHFPVFNSSVEGTNIVYRQAINLGIAVALETGLIVPVIKHAEEKNFLGIARAVQDLAERAR
ncbi:MAG: dihydrolipoamide acetyltransferase family protein, partial [Acidobacteriota bacterium]